MKRRVLSDLLPVGNSHAVLREVLRCSGLADHPREKAVVTGAFDIARRLYQGRLAGYLGCDTPYHDLAHAVETFLTFGRLLHGALPDTPAIAPRDIAVALTAAILHDAGYIRKNSEAAAKGANFQSEHELRSIDFVDQHCGALDLDRPAVEDCRAMIRGTIMAEDVTAMSYRSAVQELLVRMLCVADLMAQLSSATYLERLVYLYEEDRQAPRSRYLNVDDCFRKALTFDDLARARIKKGLSQANAFLTRHFATRWNRPVNLYAIAMDSQIRFLATVLTKEYFDPKRNLRRWGSMLDLQQLMKGT